MWEMILYAWLATTPYEGEGSVKIEMKDGETSTPHYYKTEEDCIEYAGNFNLQQWHSLLVREGNYGEGYEPLRLCVKVTPKKSVAAPQSREAAIREHERRKLELLRQESEE